MKRPLQLIQVREGRLQALPHAEELLSSLGPLPVRVVAVAGKYRTGVSYLASKMLHEDAAFTMGQGYEKCTRGVWMGVEQVESQVRIVLDVEGFGSLGESSQDCIQLFVVSMLLASTFVFNSVAVIDQHSLNLLDAVIGMAGRLLGEQPVALPFFLWLVRDFSLQLADKQGRLLSESQYLEHALRETQTDHPIHFSKNRIRREFKTTFEERDCRTLAFPVAEPRDLRRLGQRESVRLRPQFQSKLQQVRRQVWQRSGLKHFDGKLLTGSGLFGLAKYYVDCLNSSNKVQVGDAWALLGRRMALQAFEDCLRRAQHIIRTALPQLLQASLDNLFSQLEKQLQIWGQEQQGQLQRFKAEVQRMIAQGLGREPQDIQQRQPGRRKTVAKKHEQPHMMAQLQRLKEQQAQLKSLMGLVGESFQSQISGQRQAIERLIREQVVFRLESMDMRLSQVQIRSQSQFRIQERPVRGQKKRETYVSIEQCLGSFQRADIAVQSSPFLQKAQPPSPSPSKACLRPILSVEQIYAFEGVSDTYETAFLLRTRTSTNQQFSVIRTLGHVRQLLRAVGSASLAQKARGLLDQPCSSVFPSEAESLAKWKQPAIQRLLQQLLNRHFPENETLKYFLGVQWP